MNYRQRLIDRMGVPVSQAQVMAGAVNTAYLEAGDGPPVICLHGAGAGAVTWYPTVGALAQNYRVIAPDIVGYGESDKPDAAYDRPFFSAWLKDFLSALAIPRAHIIGLSQGGAIALQFTLDHPEMVDRLVLVDSAALGARPEILPLAGMIWLNALPSSLANRFFSRYLLVNPSNRNPDHGRYSVQVLQRAGGKKVFSQGRGAAVAAIPEDALRQIHHQTLILWGENDRLFAIEHGEAAVRTLPNARLCRLPEAGHLPLMDQPQAFNDAVIGFLDGAGKGDHRNSAPSSVIGQGV
ncbi:MULTISPECIES: alpha/beta fold hydrolase [Marinobacter]|uniref:alpha/beta fold hydrolase n=1 Tax=Marinobacter TaxID=2742 RepID=UPI001D098D1E|nr:MULTISPECIES: alpha/beta hydrolase [Marinobacter]MCK7568174.1 alpha/beta hydrolase [Marinobacter xestospongiae]UDL06135.1 alpha/beta hydrolase [Marinobacter sp. CA1]